MGDILFTPPVGDSELLLAVTELELKFCTKLILRIIPRIIGPITVHQVSLIDQGRVQRRGDTQMKNATRILVSSTRMRKSLATFGNKLYPPGS